MIYLHTEILFGNKNEWTSYVLNNIHESQKHYADRKKPDLTVHTVLSHLCEIPDK